MLNAHSPICETLRVAYVEQESTAVELGKDCLDLLRRVGNEDIDASNR